MKEYRYENLFDKNIIPDDCEKFCCWASNLIKLPQLFDGLEELYCYNNKLTELPELPNGLEELDCYNNPIKYITPDMYIIMKRIYLSNKNRILISNTIFYDNSGCSSYAEFFGCE
jgi:hypothetical protein